MKKLLVNLLSSMLIVGITNNAYAEKKAIITPFETLSIKPEYKGLGNIISENITDAINETSLISMIEQNQSEEIVNQLGFKINNLSDDKNAIKLAKYFDAVYIVPGSIEVSNGKYIVEIKVIDIKNNKLSKNIKAEGKDIVELQNKLAFQILNAQGIKVNDIQKNRITKYLNGTKNIKALNLYTEAITNIEKHSYTGYETAINMLDKAMVEDKGFFLANLYKAKAMLMAALLNKQLEQKDNDYLTKGENTLKLFLSQSAYKDYKEVAKLQGIIALLKNNPDNAKINIKKALSYNPYDAESMYISWLANGEKLTDKTLDNAIKTNPFLTVLYSSLGDAYKKNAKTDDAITKYTEALKLSTKNAQANFGMANIFLNTARLDESLIKFGELLKDNKSLWNVYSGMASAYRYKDMIAESVNYYNQSIKLNPNNAQTHFDVAVLYSEQGEVEKAIDEYNQSIKLNPNNAQAHYYLGTVYSSMDKMDLSIDRFKEAIRLKSDFAEAYYELGRSYKKSAKVNEAIEAYKQSIKINPDYPESHLNLGNIYIEQDKINEAVTELKQAIKLKPDYTRAYNNLGSAYQKQGKVNDAINSYKQAIKIDPKYGSAYYNLSVIYQEQKKVKEALTELKNACQQGYVPACIETKVQAKDTVKPKQK